MQAKVYRLVDSKKQNEMDERIEETLEVSLQDYSLVFQGEVSPDTDINDIEKALPSSDVGYVADVVQLGTEYFFCATFSWLHVSTV